MRHWTVYVNVYPQCLLFPSEKNVHYKISCKWYEEHRAKMTPTIWQLHQNYKHSYWQCVLRFCWFFVCSRATIKWYSTHWKTWPTMERLLHWKCFEFVNNIMAQTENTWDRAKDQDDVNTKSQLPRSNLSIYTMKATQPKMVRHHLLYI